MNILKVKYNNKTNEATFKIHFLELETIVMLMEEDLFRIRFDLDLKKQFTTDELSTYETYLEDLHYKFNGIYKTIKINVMGDILYAE